MYNPDFWELGLDQAVLERFPNEAGIGFESGEEREARYRWEDQIERLTGRVRAIISESLTEKQCEAVILYFFYQKTQEEVAQVMGISRRVVSQHLFGISRNGKQVGGAVKKIQKRCREEQVEIRS